DGRDFIAQAVARGAVAVAREAGDGDGDHGDGAGTVKPGGDPGRAPRGRKKITVPQLDIDDLRRRIGVIAARFYGKPSARMRVIGITGTNGKTTCAWLIAQALGGFGTRCALMSTVGSGFIGAGPGDGGDGSPGGPGPGDDLQPSPLTTADALATQRALAEFAARDAAAVCVEASSHGLAQGRLSGVDFDVALLTNLSRDHLDYHRDMAAYRAAKRRLFEVAGLGCAVINLDDEFGRELLASGGAAEQFTYAIDDPAADLRARDIHADAHGIAFEADFRGEAAVVRAPLIGAVHAPNLLAALAVGLCCGHGLGELAAAARHWRAPPGRMELLPRAPGRPAVVVDYAHTPDALQRALASLAEICAGKIHLVFGCGGERDAGKRPVMGRVAERLAGRVIVTDDNPRAEDPAAITAQITAGMVAPGNATVIHERRRAIETAVAAAAPEDFVLVAGKGHEATQSVGARVLEFSD
ncbi:MAG: UDP-N-acetylmuramoyl-L-alanyl-D-glutamate--2,6-diaminopimelate ligase, partial [Gammaproteobacteria bacterium]|nr:UDP-N-acetylmuramoyl-L-alanyl-D-glutamate--2,6-diaminopimelate ligase [Gammaproteobacteria bacterium]